MTVDAIGQGHSLTDRLARACEQFARAPLPTPVLQRSKLILLDTLGAMLSASRPVFPGTDRLATFVRRECGNGPCSIVGTSLSTSATNAALMNGFLAYALDIESHHGPAVVHAAAAVLPAVLATAQEEHSDGVEVLTALALGIEIACRVSLAIGPNDLYARGFHPTSIAGSFGAAAAAAALRRLDVPHLERAFGLAATETGGLLAWASDESEESRPFNPGTAARNGITAATLAGLGFGAPRAIFDAETKYNVFRAWSADGVGNPERLMNGFGERFAVDELIIKQHACCAFLHPAVDGLLDILADTDLEPDDITAITVRFPRSGAPIINANPLRSHRAQYILPIAAVRHQVDFADVIVDRSAEPAVTRLIERTEFVPDDDLDPLYPERYTTLLSVTTVDGRQHERRVDWAMGTPENPMRDDEIIAKFRRLAGERTGQQRTDKIVQVVFGLDQANGLNELLRALTLDR
jgi:2-methylcitrate dehydratase PrpD